jgi:hypothetical protein
MNSDLIILDLRDNHGLADGVLLVQSYFFNEPTHMSDYINRDDGTTRQKKQAAVRAMGAIVMGSAGASRFMAARRCAQATF